MFTKTKLSYYTKGRLFCLTTSIIPIIIIIIIIIKNITIFIDEFYILLAFFIIIFLYTLISINRSIDDEIEHDISIENKENDAYYI